jgi:hypothetical protein
VIASTFRRPAVTAGDQAVDLLRRQIFRQICQAPRGERRHGLIQVGSAPAMDAEIPQETPQAGNQLFSGADAAPSGAFQKMGAHALCIPARGITAECQKQLGCTTRILSDGRFCGTAMLLQPPLEVDGTSDLLHHAASTNTDL